jgi:3-oxoadipate enol-lactonase
VIRIERSGQNGPTVVLLHELGGSAATFRWLTPYLTGCRTLLVNLPGTAGSTPAPEESSLGDLASLVASALESALESEGAAGAVIVGIAGGAGVAAALAAARPDLAAGLLYASLGSTITSATAEYIRARVPIVREYGMEPVADPSLARSFPEFLRAKDPAVFDGYRADFVSSNVEGYVTQGLALAASGPGLGTDLSRVAAPTVVLGGAQDELFPPQAIDAAASFVPNLVARVQLPGVAHLPHLQAPRALAGAITMLAGCTVG